MKITFLGTTTLLFDDGKDQILFDAHITRPSLLQYITNRKVYSNTEAIDKIISAHQINRLKAIFISHSHHDHVMDAAYIANKCNASIYGSSSARNVALGSIVPEKNIKVFDGEATFKVGDYSIKVIPSIHSRPTILNNDLGQTIDQPLVPPVRLRDYKEGGSYDFYIEAQGRCFLIRPSFNYLKEQLDGLKADVLFLGVAGLAKADKNTERIFFEETIDKVTPDLVIPIHWDNFFTSIEKPVKGMPHLFEKTGLALGKLVDYCEAKGISCIVQLPRTNMNV